jgi:hypothetical protein
MCAQRATSPHLSYIENKAMNQDIALPFALDAQPMALVAVVVIGLVFVIVILVVVLNFGGLWLRAYTSNASVSIFELIGMKLRLVNAGLIVDAKVMAAQAGVGTDNHQTAGGPLPSRRRRAARD